MALSKKAVTWGEIGPLLFLGLYRFQTTDVHLWEPVNHLTWVKVCGRVTCNACPIVLREAWMASLQGRKRQLLERMAELDTRLHGIEDELDAHQSKDWGELAVEREEDEVLEGIGSSGLAEVKQIRAALARIEDGSYGICARCGDEISTDRLDLLPATPFCRNCAG